MKISNYLALLLCVGPLPEVLAVPIMEGELLQQQCNAKGFFYDHRQKDCTGVPLIGCDHDSLSDELRGQEGAFERFKAVDSQLTEQGYRLSQCFVDTQGHVSASYSRKDLWLNVKTVRLE